MILKHARFGKYGPEMSFKFQSEPPSKMGCFKKFSRLEVKNLDGLELRVPTATTKSIRRSCEYPELQAPKLLSYKVPMCQGALRSSKQLLFRLTCQEFQNHLGSTSMWGYGHHLSIKPFEKPELATPSSPSCLTTIRVTIFWREAYPFPIEYIKFQTRNQAPKLTHRSCAKHEHALATRKKLFLGELSLNTLEPMATFWSLLSKMTKEKPLRPCRKGIWFWRTQNSLAQPFKPSRVYRMKSGVQHHKTWLNISTMHVNVLRAFLGRLHVLNAVSHLEAKVEKTDIFCPEMLCLPEMLMNLYRPCPSLFHFPWLLMELASGDLKLQKKNCFQILNLTQEFQEWTKSCRPHSLSGSNLQLVWSTKRVALFEHLVSNWNWKRQRIWAPFRPSVSSCVDCACRAEPCCTQ